MTKVFDLLPHAESLAKSLRRFAKATRLAAEFGCEVGYQAFDKLFPLKTPAVSATAAANDPVGAVPPPDSPAVSTGSLPDEPGAEWCYAHHTYLNQCAKELGRWHCCGAIFEEGPDHVCAGEAGCWASVDPTPSPEAPGAELDWVTWVIPAITDVLAEHEAFDYAGKVECPHQFGNDVCDDWMAWREHVAPLIAERIHEAAAAQHPAAHTKFQQ